MPVTDGDGDDRDLAVDRLLQRRRHRVDLVWTQDNAFHALGERCFDVGSLLGRGDLTVTLDRSESLLRRLGFEGVHHVDEERKAQPGDGDQDCRLVVGECGRSQGHRQQARGCNTAGDADERFLPWPADMLAGGAEPCPN